MNTKREAIVDTLFQLTSAQKASVRSLIDQLGKLESTEISIDNYHLVNNCIKELNILKDHFVIKLLASAKRGDILE